MPEQSLRATNKHFIQKLNISNIPLPESKEYDIWWILYFGFNCTKFYIDKYTIYIFTEVEETGVNCSQSL